MAFQHLCGAVVVLAVGLSITLGLLERGGCFPPAPESSVALGSVLLALTMIYEGPLDS